MFLICGVGEDSWVPVLKEINPEYSLEGLMLKLKLQYFGHLMWRADSLEKTLMLGKTEGRQEEKGTREDKMVGWHHWLNGHEFEQALEDSNGQGSLACCSSWVYKELDIAEWLKNNKDIISLILLSLFIILNLLNVYFSLCFENWCSFIIRGRFKE